MKTFARISLLTALAGSAGCASNIVHEGKYAQDEGWRKGEIVQMGPASSMTRHAFRDCRKKLTEDGDDARYAAVAYRRNGGHYAHIVKIPGEAQLQVGSRVYVNIDSCDAPLPTRTE